MIKGPKAKQKVICGINFYSQSEKNFLEPTPRLNFMKSMRLLAKNGIK